MSKTVTLPYDPTWQALDWAKANCKSYITKQDYFRDGWLGAPAEIKYFFADERDAILFTLRWS